MVLHSVWNISPTVAIGDNPLYENSFDEWIGSGGASGSDTSNWIRSRILTLSKGKTKSRINDIMEQVDEAIFKHKSVDYSRPVITVYILIKRYGCATADNLIKRLCITIVQ